MTIIAMITARSTSSRFPRKHLADLGGLPMIVQIINRLKKLKELDEIVLATTDNPEDDQLSIISETYAVTVVRGSEKNLAARHGQVISKTNPTHVIDVSGDCPFFDTRALQMIIYSMRDNPNYDIYGVTGPYSMLPGLIFGGHSLQWYQKAWQIFAKHHTEYSAEQYWIATRLYPERFSTFMIDGSSRIDKTVTPMKMSIDWNIERLFWNKIIKHLGFFPRGIDDINDAFKTITEL